eukprot:TRINITY_DN1736_c0_g1::TRINITY_DN1736_c0_g1_i1::g.25229::m.25229 TRINITY_DN1736_c0_g1::TRINITY_DN1736_c0_g1_i1::g.25229  ORF type:complete len:123 (-),score=1.40,Tafi-CsgC/PF10610.4/6.5e+03,Tafi-CsgC/PF10610.4/0.094 TRINITY_DN1736_c0_g1_i1:809-1177(-)
MNMEYTVECICQNISIIYLHLHHQPRVSISITRFGYWWISLQNNGGVSTFLISCLRGPGGGSSGMNREIVESAGERVILIEQQKYLLKVPDNQPIDAPDFIMEIAPRDILMILEKLNVHIIG